MNVSNLLADDGPRVHVFFDGKVPAELLRRVEEIRGYPGVAAMAVMPDAHIAGVSAVGLVVAATDVLYPSLIGEDIGCGMASVRLGRLPRQTPEEVLERLQRAVPVHRHREPQPVPEMGGLSTERLNRIAARDGARQFATLGGGNHFLELQHDTAGEYWLTVHTGSRGMGSAVSQGVLGRGLSVGSAEGRDYLRDQQWCRDYARGSRLAVLANAVAAMEAAADWGSVVACDHNHVSVEDGFYVHRKGATPARAGEAAVIAGSMGTLTFHIEGRGYGPALNSASHGAGRCLTRTEARRRISVKELRRQMADVHYDVRLQASLREEAPGAYRDIRRVLRVQKELLKITRELRPLVVHKG